MWNKTQWLGQSESSRIIQLSKPLADDGFILGNLEAAGFYRVNYDAKSWNNIVQQLNTKRDVIFKLDYYFNFMKTFNSQIGYTYTA